MLTQLRESLVYSLVKTLDPKESWHVDASEEKPAPSKKGKVAVYIMGTFYKYVDG